MPAALCLCYAISQIIFIKEISVKQDYHRWIIMCQLLFILDCTLLRIANDGVNLGPYFEIWKLSVEEWFYFRLNKHIKQLLWVLNQ